MSTVDKFPVRSPVPGLEAHVTKFVGGSAAVTKVYGEGCTVTYISSGIVDITFPEQCGTFEGAVGTFQADTPANVKSYALVPSSFTTTTRTLRLNMYESGTLTDLAALEYLTVVAFFKANP